MAVSWERLIWFSIAPLHTQATKIQASTDRGSLLLYLDARHRGFLPRWLTLGEAWQLGPRQIREGSLLSVRDGSDERVFHDWAEHIPIEDPVAVSPIERPIIEEVVDSFLEGTEPEESVAEMVVRRKMTIDRFLPDGRATPQQQILGNFVHVVDDRSADARFLSLVSFSKVST